MASDAVTLKYFIIRVVTSPQASVFTVRWRPRTRKDVAPVGFGTSALGRCRLCSRKLGSMEAITRGVTSQRDVLVPPLPGRCGCTRCRSVRRARVQTSRPQLYNVINEILPSLEGSPFDFLGIRMLEGI